MHRRTSRGLLQGSPPTHMREISISTSSLTPVPPKPARKGNSVTGIDINPTVPVGILLVASLGQRHNGICRTQPGRVAVWLHPVVLEPFGLGGEHVGEVPERHARRDGAGGGQELGALAVGLRVPGRLSVD